MAAEGAPRADCQRFLSLKQGLDAGVSRGVSCMDFEDFKRLFDGITDEQRLGLFDLYRQVARQICTHSQAFVDELAVEQDLNATFSSLEDLEREHHAQESRLREPSVQPEAAARSCRVRAKRAEAEALEEALQQAEQARSTAADEAGQKQAQLEQAVAAYNAIPESLREVHRVSEMWVARSAVA